MKLPSLFARGCASPLAKLALAATVAATPLAFGSKAIAQDTIRFGAPLPLTSANAAEAHKQQQDDNQWAEEVNKAGGIEVRGKKMTVEIVFTDYPSNTARAVQTAEQLITQDKVHFLFSLFGTDAA